MHELRLATLDDLPRLRRFIDEHWKKDHILARDEAFFRYEHIQGERVNFALALDTTTREIDGVLGFLKYTESYEAADIFTVVWKVREGTKSPVLGLKLLAFLQKDCGFASVSSCGINQATVPIYRRYGFETGTLAHHYLLNPQLERFAIARIEDRSGPNPHVRSADLRELSSADELARLATRSPRKDVWYLRRRYFEHPISHYRVFGIDGAALVTREEPAAGAIALRVVEIFGDESQIAQIGDGLRELVVAGGYEYADLYEVGLARQTTEALGFRTRTADDPNIIPNYFAPYVQKNIDLRYATMIAGARMFKGDGDQDRPS